MKRIISTVIAVAVLAFGCAVHAQTFGQNVFPVNAISYGPVSGTWFSTTGGNNAVGYTNDVKAVNISGSDKVSVGCYAVGYNANCSNNIVIKMWPSHDGVNKDGTVNGSGTLTAAAPLAWQITMLGQTPVTVYTNLSVASASASTIALSPYLLVQVESAAANQTPPTNLVVTFTVKK